MNQTTQPPFGQVASLHLHPAVPGALLQSTTEVQMIVGKGIEGDARYFGRLSRNAGKPTRRQVTLMEREQIAEHAVALGMKSIAPGLVRSNVETTGIDLIFLVGEEVEIGEAVLFLHTPRDPCEKMDAICQGLRERMLPDRQGVLAEVRRSGKVRVGDRIRVVARATAGTKSSGALRGATILFSNSSGDSGVINFMKKSDPNSGISRRRFLAATSLALAAPTFVPSSVFGASERVTLGVVGWGMQGPGNTDAFLGIKECQVVAACDLDKNHLQAAANKINERNGNQDCKTYHDYREMMARKDIDAVMLAVPDNWHALVATEAANNKKDIYGEKPLARTIAEQQAIVKAVQQNQRIWQTGSWQRSQAPFRKAAEIVRNGLIGKVTRVEVGLPAGHTDFARTGKFMTATEPPAELDYETWIGPAKMEPYIKGRVHMNWRWNYNIGGGQLLDWIGHHCDIAHWGMDCDQTGGPIDIEGVGEFPAKDAVWNTATKYRVTCSYPNDITMVIAGGHSDIRGGTKWIGTDGWVWVDRGGFDASNVDWFREIPADKYKVKLYRSDNHQKNFIDCVKSRQPTITPVETAHHSAIPGHLGLIAMLVGHKIKWDSAQQVIVGDEEATKLMSRGYRSPWKLQLA